MHVPSYSLRRVLPFVLGLAVVFSTVSVSPVLAQATPPATSGSLQEASELLEATLSASQSASQSATATASASAQVEQKIEEKKERDITETGSSAKSRLQAVLDDNPVGQLSVVNFMQHAIRRAVSQGVPANMLVLILLFPLLASLIAASRHLIGLRGFGVYAPAVLSVALLSTGIITGVFLFILIIFLVSLARTLVRPLKLQYLPRTALLMWVVSLGVFGFLLISPYLLQSGIDLITITIFPILVLILLSENFMEVTSSSTQSYALELTLETIFLAVISALIMRTETVQDFVILNPEITIGAVFLIDILVGRYTGLRVSEYFRFRPILDPEEEEPES